MRLTNKFEITDETLDEVLTYYYNKKYWIIQMRIAFAIVTLIALSLIATGVWSYHFATGIIVEGVILFIFEMLKNNKILKTTNKLGFFKSRNVELKIFETGIEINCDVFRVFDTWESFSRFDQTKNYFILFKNKGTPVLIKKNSFESSSMLNEFKHCIENSIFKANKIKK